MRTSGFRSATVHSLKVSSARIDLGLNGINEKANRIIKLLMLHVGRDIACHPERGCLNFCVRGSVDLRAA